MALPWGDHGFMALPWLHVIAMGCHVGVPRACHETYVVHGTAMTSLQCHEITMSIGWDAVGLPWDCHGTATGL